MNDKGEIEVNKYFLDERLSAYKTMFPNLDCLGWYQTGSE
jgi:hypothetical protein